MRALAAVALAVGMAGAVPAWARAEAVLGCREDVLVFESLRYGTFDYCRLHLRYRPGRFDCLRILLPACNVLTEEEPVRTYAGKADRILHGQAEQILCPPGPPPPSCPAGFSGDSSLWP